MIQKKENTMKFLGKATSLIVTASALVVCFITLFGAISLHRYTLNQNKTYTGSVEATVIDYEVRQEEIESTDSNGNSTTTIEDMYYPIFQYTVDDQEYETVSDTGSSEETYEVNTRLTIKYLPEDPTQFYVEGDAFRTYLPYVLYAISLVALIITIRSALSIIRR